MTWVVFVLLTVAVVTRGDVASIISRFDTDAPDGPSQIQLHISHGSREFRITAHDTNLLDNAVLSSVDHRGIHKPATVSSHRWFAGRLDNDPGSHVRLTVTNSSFYGNIHTSDGHTFVVNNQDDIMTIDHAESPSHTCESNTIPPKFVNASTRSRIRREPPKSSAHTHCEIFLDADQLFYNYWGGDGTEEKRISSTIIKMIDVIYQVDGIYHLARNLDGNVALQIVGTKVHTTRTFTQQTQAPSGSAMLQAYQEWLADFAATPSNNQRGDQTPLFDEVCLNHLFTHQNLGGVLGVAIQASPRVDTVGGVCETHTVDSAALNVGFTNTVTADDGVVPSWQSALSTAHEIGHNLGAAHDCELRVSTGDDKGLCSDIQGSSICVPSAERGGTFLMYPAVDIRNDHVNSQLFSPCSLAQIYDVVQAKGSCLVQPVQCDNGGSCCVGTSLLPEGSTCRAAPANEPCLRSAVCTGLSPGCPAFRIVPNETPCKHPTSGVSGVCYDGTCVHNHHAFCQSQGLEGCTIEGNDCIRSCKKTGSDLCAAFEQVCQVKTPGTDLIQWWSETSATCPVAPAGSPCFTDGNEHGQCSTMGTCLSCGSVDCATNIDLEDDNLVLECKYKIDFRASCSEPCGGGVQTVLYACFCGESRDSSGARCGTSLSPSASELCNQQECSTSAPQNLLVIVEFNPEEFDPEAFSSTLQDILLMPVQVSRYSRSQEPKDTDVYLVSCRQSESECLFSSELQELLDDPENKDRIAASGYSYVFEQEESTQFFTTQVLIIIIASIVIAGVIIGVAFFFLGRRNRKDDAEISPEFPQLSPGANRIYRVLYPYNTRNPDELELKVGMVVTVVGESEDPGWWLGRCGMEMGIFPSTFVELIPNLSDTRKDIAAKSDAGSHSTEV